jgi:hypothetical protein
LTTPENECRPMNFLPQDLSGRLVVVAAAEGFALILHTSA